MKESEKQNQSIFTLSTSLSYEEYRTAESMIKKTDINNYSIYHQKKFVGKLQFISEQDQETYHLFQKENNFILEIPETSKPELIPLIIHYIYFKEVKALSFEEIINFLDLVIFFQIKDLIQKIINFLKENIDTAKNAVFLRLALYPLIKKTDFHASNSLKELLTICETFLLSNGYMKEYLSFYVQYNSIYYEIQDIENDLFNGLDMMKIYKQNGKYMLKLLFFFKDRLCELKKEKNEFDFKAYAEGIIEKYVNLVEICNTSLIKSFTRLGLNLNEYKISIANEKIAELENEVKSLKEM